ncbi:DUF1707 and DUF4870 domain-containing protein [Lipingzhangella sp. LS1_29]|uniref:DUF1707 and DUF4870 domain-containing protein n=1 Tax=Lipingzhangella rawalii TaxID=2055835 RepID=A0ABU2H902_9ACTN|nr:DUF1707 and DUF4870 domain-containing protein [Lipingzhangella rawalii]MDS1271487.1 DUF1707 and DUF4870 domain-containing protein [Lipingzhangella rawalii]
MTVRDMPRWGVDRPQSGVPERQLRLTHADRDAMIERLNQAYANGQLDEEELGHRVELAMRAKVRADLEPLDSDLGMSPRGSAAAPYRTSEPTGTERWLAAAGHVSGYFTSALGPLIVLLVGRNSSPFLRRHAMEALNYQLMMLVFSLLLIPITILTLGIGLVVYLVLLVGWLVFPALGGIVALCSGTWRYPLTWRAIKDEPS